MRASVKLRRAEQARKQARRKEIEGIIGAISCGIVLALPFIIYSLAY